MVLLAAVCTGCERPAGSSNLWDGFEGIRWGEPPQTAPWLEKQKGGIYVPKGRTVTLAGLPADQAEFEFVDGKGFLGITLRFKGHKGFLAAKEYLFAKYGKGENPSCLEPPAEIYQWTLQRGLSSPIDMTLWYFCEKDEWVFGAADVKKLITIPY